MGKLPGFRNILRNEVENRKPIFRIIKAAKVNVKMHPDKFRGLKKSNNFGFWPFKPKIA